MNHGVVASFPDLNRFLDPSLVSCICLVPWLSTITPQTRYNSLPCMNCDLEYIGETGRKFGTRLNEHRTEVEKVSRSVVMRASRKESLSTVHKSAVTDHVVESNHVIGWGGLIS